ncbi:MAG: nickel pincer cofactor biosynthesis protein LarB [Chloroflexi bacterium]|nr:nickel pincer cofactor biosynthesis protein LarB [Chloroflexota bacterium]
MNADSLREVLEQVREGERSVDDAFARLKDLPYQDLGFARLDHHRALRQGFPEVVFCEGKRTEHTVAILQQLAREHANGLVMGTRVTPETFRAIAAVLPHARYFPDARIVTLGALPEPRNADAMILVACAGTADLPIAEEAALTAQAMGSRIVKLYDVGVAGIHRLLDARDKLSEANVIIVVAGMDGALPAVIGGLVACPVIALPTSIGYGTGLGGVAALMTMLNACAPGIAVVNIDNGFGAGYLAHLINSRTRKTA